MAVVNMGRKLSNSIDLTYTKKFCEYPEDAVTANVDKATVQIWFIKVHLASLMTVG